MNNLNPIFSDHRVKKLARSINDKAGLLADLHQKTTQLIRKDINSWRRAHQQAIDVENPRRRALYTIYDDILIDGHLTGAIEHNRKNDTLQRAFKVVDNKGNKIQDLTDYLESGWFKKLISLALDCKFYGHSLIELGKPTSINGKPTFESVKLIPREHVSPELGVYIIDPDDEWKKGIPYRSPELYPWLIEANDDSLGLLLKCCPPAISKRNILAFWDEFAEIFGMPIRIGTTNSRDRKEQMKIIEMLEKMGSAAWGLFPEGTDIELKESSRGDSFEVYDRRIVRADFEMSKAILGQTMTMDNGSSYSQAEVHKSVLDKILESDADFIRDLINNELFPRLILHGWPLQNCRFDWDEKIIYTPEQQTERDRLVLQYYQLDPKYFIDQGYPILAPRNNENLSHTDDFFRLSPAQTGLALLKKKTLDSLYCPLCGEVTLASDLPEGLPEHLDKLKKNTQKLIEQIYRRKINPNDVHTPSVAITATSFVDAVDKHLADLKLSYDITTDDYKFYQTIQENCYRFSAAKNYQEILILSKMLAGPDGKIRSWEEFREMATRVLDTFRGDWLRTEYDQALVTSQRIADYRRYLQNGDIYPTWQYKTRADGHVREAHAALHDFELAANDPAWRFIYPPNGWRCRCYVKPLSEKAPPHHAGEKAIEVLKNDIDSKGQSEFEKMQAQGFASNPAADGIIFPQKHPYWNNVPDEVLRKASLMAPENFRRVHTARNGVGWVDVHPLQNNQELQNNLNIAIAFADKFGDQIRLLPIDPTQKNADAQFVSRSNASYEFKTANTSNTKNFLNNRLRAGKKQANRLVLSLKNLNINQIISGLLSAFMNNRADQVVELKLYYRGIFVDVPINLARKKEIGKLRNRLIKEIRQAKGDLPDGGPGT